MPKTVAESDIDKYVSDILRHYEAGKKSSIRSKLLLTVASSIGNHSGSFTVEVQAKCKTAAKAIETIHTGSLIHDDILDDAITRRGIESLNTQYGHKMAMVTGDVTLANGLSIMAKTNDGYAMSFLIQTVRKMCEGQMQELAWMDKEYQPRIGEILAMYRKKTGALMGLCARLGAYFTITHELNDSLLNDLDQISADGENFGIAFQILDDIKDIDEDKNNKVPTVATLVGISDAQKIADELLSQSHFDDLLETSK